MKTPSIHLFLHKISGEIFLCVPSVIGTQLYNKNGDVFLLCQIGCWSDFEDLGEF